jgi:hypothetical protein
LEVQPKNSMEVKCVVPVRKELTISRIIDNPSEMMTNWVLPNNTEEFSPSNWSGGGMVDA